MFGHSEVTLTRPANNSSNYYSLAIFAYANIIWHMDTESLAAIFKTLSEPVRLRITYLLLEKGELCVCDLVDTLELSQSVVSRHLAYLRNNNLVSTRREGVWIYYRITECCCEPLFEYIRQSGEKNAEMQADVARLETVAQHAKCG